MKTLILYSVLQLIALIGLSQTSTQYSLKYINPQLFNPAITGSQPGHQLFLHHRVQWIGFGDAPSFRFASYTAQITPRMGLGAHVLHNKTESLTETNARISYAYNIPFSRFVLSMGISAEMHQYHINLTKIDFENTNDRLILGNEHRKSLLPDASAGIYCHNQRFLLGFSATGIIPPDATGEQDIDIVYNTMYYLMAAYRLSINNSFEIIPSTIISGSEKEPVQMEIGFRTEWNKQLILGVYYRSEDAISILGGLRLIKRVTLVYSYDLVTSDLRTYQSGSHEIALHFRFFANRNKKPMYQKSNHIELSPALF